MNELVSKLCRSTKPEDSLLDVNTVVPAQPTAQMDFILVPKPVIDAHPTVPKKLPSFAKISAKAQSSAFKVVITNSTVPEDSSSIDIPVAQSQQVVSNVKPLIQSPSIASEVKAIVKAHPTAVQSSSRKRNASPEQKSSMLTVHNIICKHPLASAFREPVPDSVFGYSMVIKK